MHDEDPEPAEDFSPGLGIDAHASLSPHTRLQVKDPEQAMNRASSRANPAAAGVGDNENPPDSVDQAKGSPEVDHAPVGPGLLIIRGGDDQVVPLGEERALIGSGHGSCAFLASAGRARL